MIFEFDENKSLTNLAKHGIDFIGVQIFLSKNAKIIPYLFFQREK